MFHKTLSRQIHLYFLELILRYYYRLCMELNYYKLSARFGLVQDYNNFLLF